MSEKIKHIAVFASGNGSNAENMVTYFNGGKTAMVTRILTDRKDAGVISRGERLGVPVTVFGAEELKGGKILGLLREWGIDFIVLGGFLRMIPHDILEEYRHRIVNIHPSLLPKYGGKGMYGMNVHNAVVQAGERETGITIHHVNEHYDSGDIIFQTSVTVEKSDTPCDVAAKISTLEKEHFPRVVESLIKEMR